MEGRKELSYISLLFGSKIFPNRLPFVPYWPELCDVSTSSSKGVWVSAYLAKGKCIYNNWPELVVIHPLGLGTFLLDTGSGFYCQGRRGDGYILGVNHDCPLGNSRCHLSSSSHDWLYGNEHWPNLDQSDSLPLEFELRTQESVFPDSSALHSMIELGIFPISLLLVGFCFLKSESLIKPEAQLNGLN